MPEPTDLGKGRWRVRVFIGRDPITGDQLTRTHTFEAGGIRAAKAKAGELERQDRASTGGRVTFGQAVEAWWEDWSTSKGSALTTRREYRRRIDHDIKSAERLWATMVDKIGPAEINRYYKHLHQLGHSPASVRRVHAIVRQVFDRLFDHQVIATTPTRKPWLPTAVDPDLRIPGPVELEAIILAADRRDLTRGVCFLAAAGTAMRRGELVGLRWSKVDLVARTVTVDTASVMGGQLKGTKTGKRGVVGFDPLVAGGLALLRRYQEGQLAAGRLNRPSEDSWFVFSTTPPFDRPPNEQTVTNWFRQACKDVGVTGVRLHDLRHWAVSNALAQGVAPTDVQAMSRHASLHTMLDVYGHAVGEAASRATASLPLPAIEWGQDRRTLELPEPDPT